MYALRCVRCWYRTDYAAGLLAVFCVATAVVFHHDFANAAERNVFFKDLAIAGALMVIAATTAMKS